MITVKATREGLPGSKTASGYLIDGVVPFVALPSRKALGRFVRLKNPANMREALAIVLDVGPWNVEDDDYVFCKATQQSATAEDEVRPAAEAGKSLSGKGTNGAGIDLGGRIWNALGMTDNGSISWEFLN